jgi:hypothetical protein
MVDQESGTYRPRRAFVEPDPEPEPPPAPPAAISRPPAVDEPRTGPPNASAPPAPDFVDEDAPKPLYRDEYSPRPLYRDEPSGIGQEMSDDTAGRSITFVPRPRRTDDETTAIIARTQTPRGRSRSLASLDRTDDDIDDFDTDEERKPRSERTRWALALGAVAAVVVVGLAIGYAVFGIGDQQGLVPSPTLSAGTGTTAPTTGTSGDPSTTGGVLLTEGSMLSAAQAKRLNSKRTWKVVLTQRGASQDAPVAACFGAEPEDGQPVSQQKILRVLSSTGKSSPSALHEATAYATPEEAVQAFAVAARTLGTCSTPGTYLAAGRIVGGVGDQSVSAIAAVLDGKATSSHSVIVSRTGRVVNILDASGPGDGVPVPNTAAALAEVTKVQCSAAGGKCAGGVQVRPGPPPLGGDEPGFLAAGDLPPAGGSLTPWNAAPVELPSEDFPGSSCETVNWTTVPAEHRDTRVYLHPDSGRNYFGVNEIRVTTKDAKAATALVDKIKKDLETCKERRLTATVKDPVKISGIGARSTKIVGYTAVVEQKRSGGSDKFRVGIVAAGRKVAYTFANPKGDFDFTDKQWDTIAVRAGERFTQVT